jgi:hypothetical protein
VKPKRERESRPTYHLHIGERCSKKKKIRMKNPEAAAAATAVRIKRQITKMDDPI